MTQSRKVQIPSKMRPFFTERSRYKVAYGGRGGGKSRSIATGLVIKSMQDQLFIGCFREIQKSIKESVKKVIDDEIDRLELRRHFTSTETEIRCNLTGSRFVFFGIRYNPDAVKSMEGLDIAWLEEADRVSQASWDILIPTVRKPGSEIWASFNPRNVADPVYQRFVVGPVPAGSIVIQINYYDNPWFPDVLREEMEFDKEHFPRKYRSVWRGEPGVSEFQIIRPEWWRYYADREEVISRCSFLFCTGDTAYKTGQHNDFSDFKLWGCEGSKRLYMLDSLHGKYEFPQLLKETKRFWDRVSSRSDGKVPSRLYLEDKASGISLVQTLRQQGVPVVPWKPKDYNFPDDKVGRVNESSFVIAQGDVWIPDPSIAPWIDSTVDEHSSFTADDSHVNDDEVDNTTIAISIWRHYGGGRRRGQEQATG